MVERLAPVPQSPRATACRAQHRDRRGQHRFSVCAAIRPMVAQDPVPTSGRGETRIQAVDLEPHDRVADRRIGRIRCRHGEPTRLPVGRVGWCGSDLAALATSASSCSSMSSARRSGRVRWRRMPVIDGVRSDPCRWPPRRGQSAAPALLGPYGLRAADQTKCMPQGSCSYTPLALRRDVVRALHGPMMRLAGLVATAEPCIGIGAPIEQQLALLATMRPSRPLRCACRVVVAPRPASGERTP